MWEREKKNGDWGQVRKSQGGTVPTIEHYSLGLIHKFILILSSVVNLCLLATRYICAYFFLTTVWDVINFGYSFLHFPPWLWLATQYFLYTYNYIRVCIYIYVCMYILCYVTLQVAILREQIWWQTDAGCCGSWAVDWFASWTS